MPDCPSLLTNKTDLREASVHWMWNLYPVFPTVFTAEDTTIVTNSDKRVVAHMSNIEKLVSPLDEIVVELTLCPSP